MVTATVTPLEEIATTGTRYGTAMDILTDAYGLITTPGGWTRWENAIDRNGNCCHPNYASAWSIAGAVCKAGLHRQDPHAYRVAFRALEIEALRNGADSLRTANSGDQPHDHQLDSEDHQAWLGMLFEDARQSLADKLACMDLGLPKAKLDAALENLRTAWHAWQDAQADLRNWQIEEGAARRKQIEGCTHVQELAPQSETTLRMMREVRTLETLWRIARGVVAADLVEKQTCRLDGAHPVYICLQAAQRLAGLPEGPNGNGGYYQNWVRRNTGAGA